MEFLYFLEGLHNPVLDFLFQLITLLGDETVFLIIAMFVFWCVDKREGYYVLISGLFGVIVNQGLKMLCRVERPWVQNRSFKIDPAVKEAAGGYSFPSGHSQNITATLGGIFAWNKKRWLRILLSSVIVLVCFSRMYLLVHTPLDVCVGALLSVVIISAFYPLFKSDRLFRKAVPFVIGGIFILSLLLLIYAHTLPSSIETSDPVLYESYLINLESIRKNSATLFGCTLGLLAVYPLDLFLIKFETKARWYSNLLKLIGGALVVFLLLEGLEAPLEALFGLFFDEPRYIARALRYFLVVAFAGIVWPLTFKYFSKLEIPFMERVTKWLGSRFVKIQHDGGLKPKNDN